MVLVTLDYDELQRSIAYYLLSVKKSGVVLPAVSAAPAPSAPAPQTPKSPESPSKKKKRNKSKSPKSKAQDDDDIDLFGDDDPAAAEEAKKLAEKKKAEIAATKKAAPVAKSILLIDVKPTSTEVNLDDLWKLIREIKMDGLIWKEQVKKVPVAFGIFKLQVGCTIEDDKVSTDELIELIEKAGLTEEEIANREAEDYDEDEDESGLVQSAEIVVFNKL